MTEENPLKKHFRTISLYLELPSKCKFYNDDDVSPTENGEFPVYPMTARGEILLQTPDALMNGEATKQVIESCVPNIKNAAVLLTNDLDAVLIAIRIASYGHLMELESTCPKCVESSSMELDLRGVLDNTKNLSAEALKVNDLIVNIKPHTFESLNTINLQTYEEQRIISLLENAEQNEMSTEDISRHFKESLKKMTNLSLFSMIDQISSIIVDENTVTDVNHIEEFFNNCDKKSYTEIYDAVSDFNSRGSLDKLHIICSHCQHEYNSPLEFNATTFFE